MPAKHDINVRQLDEPWCQADGVESRCGIIWFPDSVSVSFTRFDVADEKMRAL